MKSETCSRCGQEVRRGYRDGRLAWWHREAVDHEPVFGNASYDKAEVERQRHLPRERYVKVNPEGFPLLFEIETYTAAEVELKAMSKAARDRAAEEDEDAEPEHPLEPIEVRCTPLNLKGETVVTDVDGRERVTVTPGGARTLINLATKLGWDVVRLTYARGPYIGAKGGSLGVSDSVVLVVRGPVLDGSNVYGVASWRDGKSQWAWRVVDRKIDAVGARALSAWMKEVPPCGQAQ